MSLSLHTQRKKKPSVRARFFKLCSASCASHSFLSTASHNSLPSHASMADDRARKYQRLERFRRSMPHVSASALSQILQGVEASGLPERHTRSDIAAARDQRMHEDTPYGPMITEIACTSTSGAEMKIPILSPFALLYLAVRQGADDSATSSK